MVFMAHVSSDFQGFLALQWVVELQIEGRATL